MSPFESSTKPEPVAPFSLPAYSAWICTVEGSNASATATTLASPGLIGAWLTVVLPKPPEEVYAAGLSSSSRSHRAAPPTPLKAPMTSARTATSGHVQRPGRARVTGSAPGARPGTGSARGRVSGGSHESLERLAGCGNPGPGGGAGRSQPSGWVGSPEGSSVLTRPFCQGRPEPEHLSLDRRRGSVRVTGAGRDAPRTWC